MCKISRNSRDSQIYSGFPEIPRILLRFQKTQDSQKTPGILVRVDWVEEAIQLLNARVCFDWDEVILVVE